MQSLTTYNLADDRAFLYRSKIAGLISSIEYSTSSPLAGHINDLSQSYLTHWGFLLSAYDKLYEMHTALAKTDDTRNCISMFSEYDLASTNKEAEFRDYIYLCIISMKTLIDLFSCLVNISLTKEVQEETSMLDLAKLRKKLSEMTEFRILCPLFDKSKYPFLDELSDIRNRIIHRGYGIKTRFGFRKTNDIPFIIFKGTDFYSQEEPFQVGLLFERFIQTMSQFEDELCAILPSIDPSLRESIEVSYRYEDGCTYYQYREIDSIE